MDRVYVRLQRREKVNEDQIKAFMDATRKIEPTFGKPANTTPA